MVKRNYSKNSEFQGNNCDFITIAIICDICCSISLSDFFFSVQTRFISLILND